MEELESKLGAILSNPALMQQIMQMAQSFGQPSQEAADQQPAGNMDFTTIQKIASLTAENKLSRNQQNLLQALRPYLSHHRIDRLQRAMQAAKLASAATSLLGTVR